MHPALTRYKNSGCEAVTIFVLRLINVQIAQRVAATKLIPPNAHVSPRNHSGKCIISKTFLHSPALVALCPSAQSVSVTSTINGETWIWLPPINAFNTFRPISAVPRVTLYSKRSLGYRVPDLGNSGLFVSTRNLYSMGTPLLRLSTKWIVKDSFCVTFAQTSILLHRNPVPLCASTGVLSLHGPHTQYKPAGHGYPLLSHCACTTSSTSL
mmetsp:Transcript_18391/g.37104  ORF Transcript_18391/g.37104 Transcript_18391/m.37104 type:complete len:211 (-) Transcript_18391:1083-1715(-)